MGGMCEIEHGFCFGGTQNKSYCVVRVFFEHGFHGFHGFFFEGADILINAWCVEYRTRILFLGNTEIDVDA